MKKETSKWITSTEEVSIEEAVNEFFDGGWNSADWEDTESYMNSYIEEFDEISDKEENLLRSEIKREFDKRVSKLKQEEIIQLKDRKSILEVLEEVFDYNTFEEQVGYLLSPEEILDLILKNGNNK